MGKIFKDNLEPYCRSVMMSFNQLAIILPMVEFNNPLTMRRLFSFCIIKCKPGVAAERSVSMIYYAEKRYPLISIGWSGQSRVWIIEDQMENLPVDCPVTFLALAGMQMLKDVVAHCKACSKTDDAYQSFKKYVLTSSPSRTLYTLEVQLFTRM